MISARNTIRNSFVTNSASPVKNRKRSTSVLSGTLVEGPRLSYKHFGHGFFGHIPD